MNSHNVLAVALFVLRWMPLYCFRTDGTNQEPDVHQISNSIEFSQVPDFIMIMVNGSSNSFPNDYDDKVKNHIELESSLQIVEMPHYREVLKGGEIRTMCKPETEFRFYEASETSRWIRVKSVRSQTTVRITRESPEKGRYEQTRVSHRRSETREVRTQSMEEEPRRRRLENSQPRTRNRSARRSVPETSRRQTFQHIRSRREKIQESRNHRSLDTRTLQIRSNRIAESRSSSLRRETSVVDNERALETRNDLFSKRRVNGDISNTEDYGSRRLDSRRNVVRDVLTGIRDSDSNRRLESLGESSRRIDSSSEDSSRGERRSNQRQRRDSRESRIGLSRRRDDTWREADQEFHSMKSDQRRMNPDFKRSDYSQSGSLLMKVSVSLVAFLLMRGEGTAKANSFLGLSAPNRLFEPIS